jgi:hypothetical protein
MGSVDNQELKKFNHNFSSMNMTKKFQLPTTYCMVDNQNFSITNWLTIQLVTKGDQNWAIKSISIANDIVVRWQPNHFSVAI